ncbi:uncharacterized protein LOC117103529 [Anneissia japonica]|uniref:uncharacterized protein LOC117103529 n=1 Tax=Anneissia japonica TaxID=1529436 RepID=UPI001425A71F|nr:uncharacterized protein LOC117103529 [Anneissia japonica]
MIIDSGATANIIDEDLWQQLKCKQIKCKSELTNRKLYAYGSTKPLELLGKFTTNVSIFKDAGNNSSPKITAEVYVLKGKAPALLAYDTAMKMGVLNIGIPQGINSVQDKYTQDYKLHLFIDEQVTPVAQNMYRVPFSLRDKVSDKLDLNYGSHQIELDEQSRNITTFITSKGLYRYKRLMFGINAAPEKLNAESTQLVTDASNVGIGGVLLQKHDGETRVISYASRTLSDAEKKYSTTEKEALAVVWAMERFHVYLYGLDFDLITDHKTLEGRYGLKSRPNARIERWVMRLMSYSYTVKYVPGKNSIADILSRLPIETDDQQNNDSDDTEMYIRLVASNATPCALSSREVEEASKDDPELSKVRDSV